MSRKDWRSPKFLAACASSRLLYPDSRPLRAAISNMSSGSNVPATTNTASVPRGITQAHALHGLAHATHPRCGDATLPWAHPAHAKRMRKPHCERSAFQAVHSRIPAAHSVLKAFQCLRTRANEVASSRRLARRRERTASTVAATADRPANRAGLDMASGGASKRVCGASCDGSWRRINFEKYCIGGGNVTHPRGVQCCTCSDSRESDASHSLALR